MSTHVEPKDRARPNISPVDVDATLIYYARLRPATNNQVSNSTRNANESRPTHAGRFFSLPHGRNPCFGAPSAMAAVLSCQPNEGRPQFSEATHTCLQASKQVSWLEFFGLRSCTYRKFVSHLAFLKTHKLKYLKAFEYNLRYQK